MRLCLSAGHHWLVNHLWLFHVFYPFIFYHNIRVRKKIKETNAMVSIIMDIIIILCKVFASGAQIY